MCSATCSAACATCAAASVGAAPTVAPDAPIAALYYEVLADADARGSPRPVARTPLQFASVLERVYGSSAPAEISNAFSLFRYAGREPDAEALRRLRERWEQTQRPE